GPKRTHVVAAGGRLSDWKFRRLHTGLVLDDLRHPYPNRHATGGWTRHFGSTHAGRRAVGWRVRRPRLTVIRYDHHLLHGGGLRSHRPCKLSAALRCVTPRSIGHGLPGCRIFGLMAACTAYSFFVRWRSRPPIRALLCSENKHSNPGPSFSLPLSDSDFCSAL